MTDTHTTPWVEAAFEVLGDGHFHPMREVAAAMSARIPPGMAARFVEYERARLSAQRHGAPQERQRDASLDAQIAIGRRRIIVKYLMPMVKKGACVTDPDPLPAGSWNARWDFEIRWVEAGARSLHALAIEWGVHPTIVRRVLDRNPEIPRIVRGRVTRLAPEPAEQLRVEVARNRAVNPTNLLG